MNRIVILAALILQGCGAYECVDAKLVRPVIPVDREFNVELEFQGRKMNTKIRCEKYYDAICAERGNFWAIREVGYQSEYQTSKFQFVDNELGKVSILVPRCSDMVKGEKAPLAHLLLSVEDETYWLIASNGNVRTYRSSKKKILTIKLSVKVDGEPIE